jgi:hypothetical protein
VVTRAFSFGSGMLSPKVWAKALQRRDRRRQFGCCSADAPGLVSGMREAGWCCCGWTHFHSYCVQPSSVPCGFPRRKATQAVAILYAPTVKMLERGGGGVECGGSCEAESAACS